MGPNSLPDSDYLAPVDQAMHSQLTLLSTTYPVCMCFSFWLHLSYTTSQAPLGIWVFDPFPLLSTVRGPTFLSVEEKVLLTEILLIAGVGPTGLLWLRSLFLPKPNMRWPGSKHTMPLCSVIPTLRWRLCLWVYKIPSGHICQSPKTSKSMDGPRHPSALSPHIQWRLCVPLISQSKAGTERAPACPPRV